MDLENINTNTTWQQVSSSINNNNAKIAEAIIRLESTIDNGGGGGITGPVSRGDLDEDVQESLAKADTALQEVPDNYTTDEELSSKLRALLEIISTTLEGKVDKVEGKQLSTEDFTSVLKQKLEGLENFDGTQLEEDVQSLKDSIQALIMGVSDDKIDSFMDLVSFFDGIAPGTSLTELLGLIDTRFDDKQDKISNLETIEAGAAAGATAVQPDSLATVATSGSYNDLSDKPAIPSAVTAATVKGWGFYSKPNGGIPVTDLSGDVIEALDNANSALQEIPDNYTTDEKLNEQLRLLLDSIGKALENKVDKETGKQLSTEDFTKALKEKLENLEYVDSSQVEEDIQQIKENIQALLVGVSDDKIDSFMDLVSFFDGIAPGTSLTELLGLIDTRFDDKQDKISNLETIEAGAAAGATAVQPGSLAKVATSGSYNDLSNKPSIPSAVTESTVANWGFTKNTGTYSKPSGGIPYSDLAQGVKESIDRANSALQSVPDTYPTKTDVNTVITDLSKSIDGKLNNKVDKNGNKQLSTEDFTTALKNKLEGLSNFDSSAIERELTKLRNALDELVKGDATEAIESFNEIIAFLDGVSDTETLEGIIAGINREIASKQDSISDLSTIRSGAAAGATAVQPGSLAAVATSGSYNDLTNKPSIPSAVTQQTVADWGFTKNTGTYSKPSGGIPKSDLTQAVQSSLDKADSALQEVPTDVYNSIGDLSRALDNLVKGNASNGKIDGFSEVVAFLNGISESETLQAIINTINTSISGKQATISDLSTIRSGAAAGATAVQPGSLAKVATSGSYNDLSNKPSIPSAVTESTVANWGFTKNTGTYSKPSGGIPYSDLAQGVKESIDRANSALQSVPDTYPTKTDVNTVVTDLSKSIDGKLNNKVDKVTGKQLSTEDFTTALKTKLEGLSNFDSTSIMNEIGALNRTIDNLVGGGKSDGTINSISEIIAFLAGTAESTTLQSIISTLNTSINGKQATIGDLGTIRSGAAAGATAVQPGSLAAVATSGSYNDLSNKPSIPSEVTQQTVANWGFTKNTGTITEIKMNNSSKGSSGSVDLGTVLTSHQAIKQDGISGATANRFCSCTTASATAAKVASVTGGTFSLEDGARVSVRFSNQNTADNPTLNINSTGAKAIYFRNERLSVANKTLLYGTVDFVCYNSIWHLVGNFGSVSYSNLDAASGGTAVSLVTTGEKYTWNSKGTYSKPSGGIPKSDMASDVQTSLGKADNALPSSSFTAAQVIAKLKEASINIDSSGKLGIKKAPTLDFEVEGSAGISGNLVVKERFGAKVASFGNSSSTEEYAVNVTGSIYASDDVVTGDGVTMFSQRSLKDVVDERGLSLDEMLQMRPVRYTWKDKHDDRVHIGGIADDVMRVLPEVIRKTKDGILTMDYACASYAVATSLVIPVAEHEKRVGQLERELAELREELNRLKKGN